MEKKTHMYVHRIQISLLHTSVKRSSLRLDLLLLLTALPSLVYVCTVRSAVRRVLVHTGLVVGNWRSFQNNRHSIYLAIIEHLGENVP